MDVRQLAFLARQPSAALNPRHRFLGVSKRALALLLANVMFWQPIWALADGIAPSGATNTSVGQAGNGVPVINIAAPNGAGLSHNQFKDYNVGSQGVILNNATEAVQGTQLGGAIRGNSQLGGTAAGTILNEVTGGSRSQLNGYTEVAGQSARVIVANPYGVSCNGCGFINTPRVTLSTGKPVLDGDGKLDRFEVDGGSITIDGQGLNADNVDQFDLITRSAKINANIYAKQLNVVAGANNVNADTLATTPRTGNDKDKPELAIDSAALGGMYANTIKLVGTEQGVGVKLAGDMAASGGDLQIDANGHLSMAQAASSGAINVNAASADLQGSAYAGTSANVHTRGSLKNQKVLAAKDSITLSSAGQLNNNGTVQAGINPDNTRNTSGDVVLNAKTINNTANVVASRNLTVNAEQTLNNAGGTLAAGETLNASAATLDNQNQGRMLSDGSLSLTADSLLNGQKGFISSAGVLRTDIGQLNNRSGVIESGSTLDISANSLDNTNGQITALGRTGSSRFAIGGLLDNSNGALESANTDLSVAAGRLRNSGGSVLHIGSGALDLAGLNLDNAGGSLVTRGALTFDKASWTNSSLIQAKRLNVNVDSLEQTASGKLLGTDSVTGKGLNWSNAGTIASDGRVDLTLDQQLNNSGRITSASNLNLRAARVSNLGTFGSGQVLSVSTGSLLNDHALIFSGGDTRLQVSELTNLASDIYAMGNLSIDRDGQGGLADLIVNSSANIQSDGNLSLAASTIRNIRTILRTESGIYSASIVPTACIEGRTGGDCEGGKQNQPFLISQRDHLIVPEASAASSITSGGNMQLTGGELLNSSSSIAAAGNLTANLERLSNVGIEVHDTQTDGVFVGQRTRNPGFLQQMAQAFTTKYSMQSAGYDKQAMGNVEADLAQFIGLTEGEKPQEHKVTQLLVPDQRYAAIIQAGGTVSVNTRNGIDNSVVRGGYTYVGSGAKTDTKNPGYSTLVSINPQAAPDLTQQQVNPLDLPGFKLPTSQFASNPHKYLIESDPLLNSVGQSTSSDYLLSRLGINPDQAQKRLGDGFYEQRLIQQAVIARTGQRFLDDQTSDAALFKYLMDNAISSQQTLNLSVGVSLTAEQVAALTHDIVWMEQYEVAGEKVLVPVLYMAQAKNRLGPNGALIVGNDVKLGSGQSLNNSGTLRARNNLGIDAGADVANSGLIEAGNRLQVRANNNLYNHAGGIISASDVELVTVKGDLLNERSVTTHQSDSGYRSEQKQFVDNAARIEAADTLVMRSGRDVNNIGGVIKSGGDTAIQADRDVNILAATQTDSGAIGSRSSNQTITQYGSVVDAGRDFQVVAKRNISAVASQISAQRNATLAATENLTLASAANEQHAYSKSKKITSQEDHVSQVASVIKAGGDVELSAGKDMTLISSKIDAGNQAYLHSGNKLNLLAAQDSDYSLYDMKKKGAFGAKQTQRDEVTKVTNVGSQITSGGNLILASGGDQLYQVAKLNSGKDLTLQSGGAITFEGLKDLEQESHTKSKSDLAWNSAKGKGHTDETLRQSQLVAQGTLAIKAVDGLKIDVKAIDQNTISQSIDAMVKADPQLAWLKDAEKRGDVDWRQVQELHDSFKYSHSSLGQGAMLAIIIIVTALTAGTASGAVGTAFAGASSAGSGTVMAAGGISATSGTFVAAGWGNVMASAALTSFASNSAVSFINNGGDLGATLKDATSSDSLKGYAVSSVTAGLTASYFDGWTGTTTDSVTGKVSGPALNTWSGGGQFAGNQVLQGGTSTLLNKALGQGGSTDEALKSALFNTVAAASFNAVGDYTKSRYATGTPEKIVIHAMVGGLVSVATGGDFKTGALAAGANETLVGYLGDLVNHDSNLLSATSQLVGLAAAASQADGDASKLEKGAWIAKNATQYNHELHREQAEALDRQRKSNPELADRLDAAACALMKCAASIPVGTKGYDDLKQLQDRGEGYKAEIAMLEATGEFNGRSWQDWSDDALNAHGKTVQAIGAGADTASGIVGGAAGYAGMLSTAPLCVGVLTCALPAGLGALGTNSLVNAWDSASEITADFTSGEYDRVKASFNPETHPGEASITGDLAKKAGESALELTVFGAAGKYFGGGFGQAAGGTKGGGAVESAAGDGPKATASTVGSTAQNGEAATGLLSTQLAKDAKSYLTDIQSLTGRQFTPQQLELLKADLRENTYSRLSKEEVKLNRAEFDSKLQSLRVEWEKNTGASWPKETYIDKYGNQVTRNYDAHHVIENKFGGKAEWWNITPAMRGVEHQGGIHRPQGPAEKIFGK